MSGLDIEELLHLGLHATRSENPQQGIECLKRCLELDPENSRATYLLGALYAQIGMYERARAALQKAVTLDPREYTAVFQLGLLHLSSGDIDSAESAWHGLDVLADDHFLNLFRRGLTALAADDFPISVRLLDEGIAANTTNEPLNKDMQSLRASAEAALQSSGAVPAEAARSAVAERHHLLSAYRQRTEK